MKRNRKLIPILVAFSLLLSSCQLAKPKDQEGEEKAGTEDQIVGMLVFPGRMNSEISEETSLLEREGERLFGELREETYEREDGSVGKTYGFVFPEGSGLVFAGYRISPNLATGIEKEDSYWSSRVDPGIDLEKNAYITINEDSFVQMEAVIYVSDTAADLVIYPNPVYQMSTGEIYALGTAASGLHGGSMSDCSITYSQNRSDTTKDSSADEKSGYVKLTLKTIHLADYYRIIQMDEEHQVLQSADYLPREMPEEYTPDSGCAYLILEEYAEGRNVIRSVLSPDDDSKELEAFYPLENGICQKGFTRINWEVTK